MSCLLIEIFFYDCDLLFIRSASAANGLCVAVEVFGELKDDSEKYC